MNPNPIPVIDLERWRRGGSDRAEVLGEVDEAARRIGFMQMIGHGIPEAAAADLTDAMDAFFALPAAEKARYRSPSPEINRGYSPPGSEALSYSLGVVSPRDLFEAFNVGVPASDFPLLDLPPLAYPENIWPERPAGFAAAVRRWFELAQSTARTVTSVLAESLHLPAEYFEAYAGHSVDTLRLNLYSAPPGIEMEPGQLGMGPHTDYGIVTVLWSDGRPGLQVLGPDGGWIDIELEAGALLVNVGDLLARWTGDRWRSSLHRVLAPIGADGRPYRRRSAAFFHDGDVDALIETLDIDGVVRPYAPVTIGEHLAAKLGGSRALAPNSSAVREAARLTS